jgi:hypothetical protein
MPADLRTYKHSSRSFSLLASALCGVHGRLTSPVLRYPLVLWQLLGPDRARIAAKLDSDPKCLHDPFSATFLSKWKGRLLSEDCTAVLWQMAFAVAVDIAEQECHHAVVRRILKARQQTWSQFFADVSGKWFFQRLQKLSSSLDGEFVPPAPAAPQQVKRKRAPGRYHAFLNTHLRTQPMQDPRERGLSLSAAAQVARTSRYLGRVSKHIGARPGSSDAAINLAVRVWHASALLP